MSMLDRLRSFFRRKPQLPEPLVLRYQAESFKRATPGSAGFDLRVAHTTDVGRHTKVPLDARVAIPPGHVGLILPRSSAALKRNIEVVTGTIDSDYRGQLSAVMSFKHVHGGLTTVRAGEALCQLVIIPLSPIVPLERPVYSHETERGTDGFGSTGG